MNPEVEELRKFAKASITKARLEKFSVTLARATDFFHRLEAKQGGQDIAADFESAQTDLEGALEELDSACGDLESSEEKDEREDAQEQISTALADALTHFDEIMPLAVVAKPVDPHLLAECKAKLAEITALPLEARAACLPVWLDKSPDPKERERKLNCFLRVCAEAKREEIRK